MRPFVSLSMLVLCWAMAYPAEYDFKLPVKASAEVSEDSDSYNVVVSLAKTKAFSRAHNEQADYSYSEVVLNMALSKYLKVKDGYAVAYSGRLLVNRVDGGDKVSFSYKVPKDAVSLMEIEKSETMSEDASAQEEPAGQGKGKGRNLSVEGKPLSEKELIKSMPLTGYFMRYKSEFVSRINSYQDSLSGLIAKLDAEDPNAVEADFKKLFNKAMADFDETTLKETYGRDVKLLQSDSEELLGLAARARKNFDVLDAVFQRQFQVVNMPFSDDNTKTVIKLSQEIENLKKGLTEIKE